MFSLIGVSEESHKLSELMEQLDYWYIFLLAVVVAPFFEELIFRYYITKPLIFIIAVFLFLIVGFIYLMNLGMLNYVAGIPLIAGVLLTGYYSIGIKEVRHQLIVLYIGHFSYVLYFSAAIFAFVHIFNFNDAMPWYYTPVLVFPQFMIGLFLAYVRVRNGILYSMMVHSVNNMIPMLIILMVPESF